MRVLIAGGGTGGHLYPGIAIAKEFEHQVPEVRVTFVGTAKGLESKIIPDAGYELELIRVSGILGKGILKKIQSLFELPYSLYQSYRLIRRKRPDLIIGTGGYASGPVVLMAWCLGIPRVLVEPNVYPGWTNRILAPLSQKIFLSFKETGRYLMPRSRLRLTGNPIRREIANRKTSPKGKGYPRTLLLMGGSQGSHSINQAMMDALDHLESMRDTLEIIHQTGEKDLEWVKEAYKKKAFNAEVMPFLMDIPKAYAMADLVVSRSGATTVAELTASGLPAILIPFPFATHGHQEANARALESLGAVNVVLESELTGSVLASKIHALLTDPIRLHEMSRNSRAQGRPEAAGAIIAECLEFRRGKESTPHVL